MNLVRLEALDAITLLGGLPAASVDMVLTDPPYSSGGAMRSDRNAGTNAKYLSTGSANVGKVRAFEGDNAGERAQERRIAWWVDRMHRVIRPGGHLVMFCDWRTLPLAIDGVGMGGIVLRGVAPWVKPSHRPMVGGIGAGAEYAVWGTRGAMDASKGDRCVRGFFAANPVRDRVHPTQKPVDVIRWLLGLARPGSIIVDPFLGSGTSAVAAVLEGHDFIGGDVDPHWLDVARARLATETDGAPYALTGDP